MGERVVKRSNPLSGTVGKFRQFLLLKQEGVELKRREDLLKKDLLATAETEGTEDETGSQVFNLDEPITDGQKNFTGFTRQRRVSTSLNEERTELFLNAAGLLEAAQRTEVVLDHDKVFALQQEGKITESDLDSFFDTTITWAFVPKKA